MAKQPVLSGKARDLMQTDVGVIEASATLAELERRLSEGRVSGFPVLKNGLVVGVVSRADVVERLADLARPAVRRSSYYQGIESFEAEEMLETFSEAAKQNTTPAESLLVEDVMTPWIAAVLPEDSLATVARSLLENQVHRVLVLEGEKLLGLISSSDFVRLFAEGKVRAASAGPRTSSQTAS